MNVKNVKIPLLGYPAGRMTKCIVLLCSLIQKLVVVVTKILNRYPSAFKMPKSPHRNLEIH